MKKGFIRTVRTLAAALLLVGAASCSTPKNVAYFQDLDNVVIPQTAKPIQIKIQPGDKLSIIVKSKDKSLSDLFNLPVITSRLGQASGPAEGVTSRVYYGSSEGLADYTVTPEGEIDFPVLGMIKVAGMTRSELAAFIKGDLIGRDLVKDPIVTVEFLNTGISVLGEVTKPGRYDINRDELTLLDALALAGDMTIQGQRENVAVVRQEADGIHTYRIDLTNITDAVASPAYYMQQGDIIYVEPNGVRKRQTTVNGNNVLSTSFWVSVASLLTSVAVLIFK